MKTKKTTAKHCLLFVFVLFLQLTTFSQSPVTVTGRVKSDSTFVSGAAVSLVAKPGIATLTNEQGGFSLSVPANFSQNIRLKISYVGTRDTIVNATPGVELDIVLSSNAATDLANVVVTALGIKRESRALGYAVTKVSGSEFTEARENNIANALTGKVAGVNAAGLSTGPGGSSRVTIRGNSSLNGNNQPLYVINGMPIDNSTPGGSATVNGLNFNVDRGDGISGINPDDIESMTVLKGGTAAALYGSRAANGVILITTKKGKARRGIGLEYNTNITLDNIAVLPDFQYEYGQGDGGVKPTDLATSQSTGRRSWGAKIDGSTDYVGVDGKTHPYVAQKDNLKNYYNTGTTFTNNLAFSGGNSDVVYRFSMADLDAKGILPGNTFNRKTLNLSVNATLSKKVSIEALAQYNLENGRNRSQAGDALGNPNWTPLEIANTADVRWLKPGYDANGNETIWNDAAIATNGYFVINKFRESDTKNRFIGQASIVYTPIERLSIKGTVTRDFYNYKYSNIMPTGTLYIPQGQYAGITSDLSETNSQLIATYDFKVKDIGVSLLAGGNQRRFVNEQLNQSGSQYVIPYYYSFTNLATQSTIPYTARINTNSVFGSVDLSYKNLFFVNVSGRQDWFSTLSPQNNSIFYPSVGGSLVLSDLLRLPTFFNFAKLRGSWAQVGGGAPDPYSINLTYSNVPSSGLPLQNVTSNNISNPNLKPFTSTTYEAGFELQMLKNRLGLDVTYYDRKTTNDIVNTAISNTSGYNNVILNVGELRNRGIEVLLTGKPIVGKNFGWNVSYNIAYNANKVIRLADGLNSIQIANTVGNWAYLNHVVGMPFGQIVGTRMQHDAAGNVVFNATTGLPVVSALQNLGNSVAPYTMGLTNDFHYKNFNLNILLDGKFGNKVFSIFEVYATRLGKLKTTLPGREDGLDLEGVDQSGNKYTRTVAVKDLRAYYDNYKTYSDLFLHDGSFVKLRQVIFSYNIPVSGIKFVKLQGLNIGFVARNLAILYRKTKNFDPESSLTNSNAQGFESIGLPRTKSYGLNLSVRF